MSLNSAQICPSGRKFTLCKSCPSCWYWAVYLANRGSWRARRRARRTSRGRYSATVSDPTRSPSSSIWAAGTRNLQRGRRGCFGRVLTSVRLSFRFMPRKGRQNAICCAFFCKTLDFLPSRPARPRHDRRSGSCVVERQDETNPPVHYDASRV